MRVDTESREVCIAELIAENYLNEERFAVQFAGGKFRMKQWGKNKIKAELKRHQVSDVNIKTALVNIDGKAYHETLEELLRKKLSTTKNEPSAKRYRSAFSFLVSRGFEQELVSLYLSQKFKDIHYES
jgi:regulatory protein